MRGASDRVTHVQTRVPEGVKDAVGHRLDALGAPAGGDEHDVDIGEGRQGSPAEASKAHHRHGRGLGLSGLGALKEQANQALARAGQAGYALGGRPPLPPGIPVPLHVLPAPLFQEAPRLRGVFGGSEGGELPHQESSPFWVLKYCTTAWVMEAAACSW